MRKLKNVQLKGPFLLISLISIWILFVAAGAYQLLAYEYTPGSDNNIPRTWPDTSGLTFSHDSYTLLMVVHPKCSCSRASIGELSKLLARFPKLRAKVFFVTPQETGLDWAQSENWTAAENIPGIEMIHDVEGKLAQVFHAQTSGFTLLYNKEGKLLFSGGITASRGHWGANAGSEAISEIVVNGSTATKTTATFGCNLFTKK